MKLKQKSKHDFRVTDVKTGTSTIHSLIQSFVDCLLCARHCSSAEDIGREEGEQGTSSLHHSCLLSRKKIFPRCPLKSPPGVSLTVNESHDHTEVSGLPKVGSY